MNQQTRIFIRSFLDFTGAGVIGDLRLPGVSTRLFAVEPEIVAAENPAITQSKPPEELRKK